MRIAAAALAMLATTTCTQPKPTAAVGPFVESFVYRYLAYSPVSAAAAGLHSHDGVSMDEALDSFDPADLAAYATFLKDTERRAAELRTGDLSADDQADLDIVRDQIRGTLLELESIQAYKHNPTVYVELIGSALFNPLVLEYAPAEQRFGHIVARLKRVPRLLQQARANLVDAPEIWNKVAIEENQGNRALVADELARKCPSPLKPAYDAAAKDALAAIDDFAKFLKDDLSKRTSDWRLGKDKYAAKFDPALGLGLKPEEVLADAEAELARVRERMLGVAAPLRAKMFPGQAPPKSPNDLVRQVLGKVAERHATPASYFSDARRDLEEARQFVRAKNLMALPQRDNLQVIETPEFMRGIYAVGGFNPAPALEPKLGAFYWLTPIPAAWPRERVESKLREYNFYGLKLLTIHEAIPGHYLQLEYSNDLEPRVRRVLRGLIGNGPYIEGWAVYATELMIEQGYLDNDPQLLLTWYKQYLRAVANTILDVRMQAMGMTDEAAMSLMVDQTFQEKEEATAKLQRAKLSSAQLPTYFTGYRAWRRLRDQAEKRKGSAFQMAAFHEAALKAGAVPMPSLERLLSAAGW
jgi:uncharacterized protein (DUF885 family)